MGYTLYRLDQPAWSYRMANGVCDNDVVCVDVFCGGADIVCSCTDGLCSCPPPSDFSCDAIGGGCATRIGDGRPVR